MSQKIKIHFVCNGNVFRSRLAEAYAKAWLKEREIDGFQISSSGMMSWHWDHKPDDFIGPMAVKIAKQDGIEKFFSKKRTQTTTRVLADEDLIVFLRDDVMVRAEKNCKFDERKSLVWNLKDVQDWRKGTSQKTMEEWTRNYLKRKVGELMEIATETSWVDIVSEENQNEGYKMPVRLANMLGLCKRGCHAILVTPNGGTVVQKRSKTIYGAPGMLDISLGGHVDAGETVETALLREIFEEVGLKVRRSQIQFLEIYRQFRYNPSKRIGNRTFVYSYLVRLETDEPKMVLDDGELERVEILKPTQIDQLIRKGYYPGLGRLCCERKYFRRLVKESRN